MYWFLFVFYRSLGGVAYPLRQAKLLLCTKDVLPCMLSINNMDVWKYVRMSCFLKKKERPRIHVLQEIKSEDLCATSEIEVKYPFMIHESAVLSV